MDVSDEVKMNTALSVVLGALAQNQKKEAIKEVGEDVYDLLANEVTLYLMQEAMVADVEGFLKDNAK